MKGMVPKTHGIWKKNSLFQFFTLSPIRNEYPSAAFNSPSMKLISFLNSWLGKTMKNHWFPEKSGRLLNPSYVRGGRLTSHDGISNKSKVKMLFKKNESTVQVYRWRRKILSSKRMNQRALAEALFKTSVWLATLTHQCKKSRFGKVQPKRFYRHTGQMNPSTYQRWLKTMAQQYQRRDKQWQTCFKRLQ